MASWDGKLFLKSAHCARESCLSETRFLEKQSKERSSVRRAGSNVRGCSCVLPQSPTWAFTDNQQNYHQGAQEFHRPQLLSLCYQILLVLPGKWSFTALIIEHNLAVVLRAMKFLLVILCLVRSHVHSGLRSGAQVMTWAWRAWFLPHPPDKPAQLTHVDNLYVHYSCSLTQSWQLQLAFPHLITGIIFTGLRCQGNQQPKLTLSLELGRAQR